LAANRQIFYFGGFVLYGRKDGCSLELKVNGFRHENNWRYSYTQPKTVAVSFWRRPGGVRVYVFKLNANERIVRKAVGSAQFDDKAGLGALYLTNERIVFIGYERTTITSTVEEEIPLEHIEEIKAAKTFALLANAIEINTIRGRRFRFTIDNRDSWIEAIKERMDKI
jgi:hypothetical protein